MKKPNIVNAVAAVKSRTANIVNTPNKRRLFYGAGGLVGAALTTVLVYGSGLNIPMVQVKGGAFTMGCTDNAENFCQEMEIPPHGVIVSDFYIGKYEVTQKQWVKIMGENPSKNKGNDLPVENVTWDEVQEFIYKLNAFTGKNYRLPTEAEWEFAARGGVKSKKYVYSGSNNLNDVAWYDANSGDRILKDDIRDKCLENYDKDHCKDTYNNILISNKNKSRNIGTKNPNELGIFDMSGNVTEWVNDRYSENWYWNEYKSGVQIDPQGPTDNNCRTGWAARKSYSNRCAHIGRGGSWDRDIRYCHVSWRHYYYPDSRNSGLGFRLARSKTTPLREEQVEQVDYGD